MDVDELDQHLLHQFSCMGTTDKDDLVKQLQKVLVGNQLNETAAAFFLEMNNWWVKIYQIIEANQRYPYTPNSR